MTNQTLLPPKPKHDHIVSNADQDSSPEPLRSLKVKLPRGPRSKRSGPASHTPTKERNRPTSPPAPRPSSSSVRAKLVGVCLLYTLWRLFFYTLEPGFDKSCYNARRMASTRSIKSPRLYEARDPNAQVLLHSRQGEGPADRCQQADSGLVRPQ